MKKKGEIVYENHERRKEERRGEERRREEPLYATRLYVQLQRAFYHRWDLYVYTSAFFLSFSSSLSVLATPIRALSLPLRDPDRYHTCIPVESSYVHKTRTPQKSSEIYSTNIKVERRDTRKRESSREHRIMQSIWPKPARFKVILCTRGIETNKLYLAMLKIIKTNSRN